MASDRKSAVKLALKILSPQYCHATGENVTDEDIDEIRRCAGDDGGEMSPWDAACIVIRQELARDRNARVQ